MGNYRARKIHGAGRSLLEPPAPVLTIADALILATSPMADNNGGKSNLFVASSPAGPFHLALTATWDTVKDWGDIDQFPGLSLYATNTGSGVAYSGTSRPSNVISL